MTHSSDVVKSVVQTLILSNFCVGVVIKFKNFDSSEIETKFAIDWYAYLLISKLWNLKYHRCSENRTCTITLECDVRYAWNFGRIIFA